MNDEIRPPDPEAAARLEVLISRLTDAEAGDDDWAAFRALAACDPRAWRDLALAQRDHAALSVAVGVALHAADRVELPLAEGAEPPADRRIVVRAPQRHSFPRAGAWAGWAAAAAIALAWGGGRFNVAAPPNQSPTNQASILPVGSVPVGTFEDAQRAYLTFGQQENRVLSELPERLLIEARPIAVSTAPAAPGTANPRQFEVVYVRQFVERAVVNDLVRFGTDESGRAVPVPYSAPARLWAPQ